MIFALARYAGLRCPSEILRLRWEDIDWDEEDMIVRSPKAEHHIGQSQRIVPIFSDLLPILREGQELAEDGAEFVITRYRDPKQNLGTTGKKIVRRAKLEPWPKLFQNCRSSLATELVRHEPIHVVTQWTGHSPEDDAEVLSPDPQRRSHRGEEATPKATSESAAESAAVSVRIGDSRGVSRRQKHRESATFHGSRDESHGR